MASNNPLNVPAAQQRKAIAAAIAGFATGFGGVLSTGGTVGQALLAGLAGAVVAYGGAFGFTNAKPQ